ncbi:MAG: DedA family protein [Panacagrimonas sp.]
MSQALMDWAQQHQQHALLLVPLFAFMETCVGIGLFVPSLFLVIICSIFYANGWADVPTMALLALFGSSLGDHVGFYVGRALGPRIHQLGLVRRHQDKLDRTEALVRRFGRYAIFIGRFIPAIRSLVPAMLGISGFRRLGYTLLDLCACGLWALGLAGIVLGAHEIFVR